jgi:hypothetical protein
MVQELQSKERPTAPLRKSALIRFILGSCSSLFQYELILSFGAAGRGGASCARSLTLLEDMPGELRLKAISLGYCVDHIFARANSLNGFEAPAAAGCRPRVGESTSGFVKPHAVDRLPP